MRKKFASRCRAIIVPSGVAPTLDIMHACDMYIRRTAIKSRKSGDAYYTYRLVETERVDGKVKQHTLLNLGSHFSVPQDQWKDLSVHIKQLLEAQ